VTRQILKPRKLSVPEDLILGYSTRLGGVSHGSFAGLNMSANTGDDPLSVEQNRMAFLQDLGVRELDLAKPGQIHSARVLPALKPGVYPECDALITSRRGIFLSILTADCIPVLIWSDQSSAVAAVHAGWRGSETGILTKVVEGLKREYGIDPGSLYMCIGPGLRQQNFEVGQEFKAKFPKAYLSELEGRLYFDNAGLLRDQARACGLESENIEDLDICSFQDEQRFYSHRRDGQQTGRMLALIGRRYDDS